MTLPELGLLPAVGTVPPLVSLVAPEPPVTVTLPVNGAGKVVEQLNVPPLANEALVAGVAQVFVAPAGKALVNWQVALTAAPGPLLVQVVVQVTLWPGVAALGTQTVAEVVSTLCCAKLLPVLPAAGTVNVIVPLVVVPAVSPVVLVPPVPSVLYALV